MERVLAVVVLAAAAALSACAGPGDALGETTGRPQLDARWEAVPSGPLGARGFGSSHSTGEQVFVFPGVTYEPDSWENPCDEMFGSAGVQVADAGTQLACSAAPPEGTWAEGAAVFEVGSGGWRKLDAPGVGGRGRLAGDGETIAGPSLIYDIPTGVSHEVPFEDVLVYDDPMWTGEELVQIGWDYREGECSGVGQLTAAAYSPNDGRWRTQPWPLPPPCAESVTSVWTGEEVLAVVRATGEACEAVEATGDDECGVAAAWSPSGGGWEVRGATQGLATPVWDGSRVLGVRAGSVVALDPQTLETSTVARLPDDVIHDEGLWTGDALVFFDRGRPRDGLWVDVVTGTTSRIPAPPDADEPPTFGAVVEPVDGGLFVWGGAADYETPSRNSSDGWLLRVTGKVSADEEFQDAEDG